MENVLIVSSNKSASEALADFIKVSFQCVPRVVESAYQAKTVFDSNPAIELVLINSPLMDESGLGLADFIIESTVSNCILLIKQENASKIEERAEESGIIVVGKPFNRNVLYQLIKTVDVAVKRSLKLYQETVRLEKKITEIQTIDKAKFMMMEYMHMTETEAHAYIEQYAMNKRKKKSIAALEIIDNINEQYL